MTKCIRDYRSSFPEVEIELVGENTTQQLEALRSGRIDVGFVRPQAAEIEDLLFHLFDEPMIVALPVGHSLAEKGALWLDELSNDPFITYPLEKGRAL